MTDRPRTAAGTRLLALGMSAGATLALMGGMAAAPDQAGTATDPPGSGTLQDQQRPAGPPALQPTTAPPTTSSHAS